MIPATSNKGQVKYGDTLLKIGNVGGRFFGRAIHGLHAGESFYLAPSPTGRIQPDQFAQKLAHATVQGYVWADQCFLSSDKTTLYPSYLTVLKRGGCRQTRVVGSYCAVDVFIPVTGMATCVDDLVVARSRGAPIDLYLSAFKTDEATSTGSIAEIGEMLVNLCNRSSSISWTPSLLVVDASGDALSLRAQRINAQYDIERTQRFVAEHDDLSQRLSEGSVRVVPGGSLRMSKRSVDAFFRRLFSGAAKGNRVIEHFMQTIRTEVGGIKLGPGVICSQIKSGPKGAYEFATDFKFAGDWGSPIEILTALPYGN